MAKSKSKQEEALQFLDALDSFTPPPTAVGNQASSDHPASPPDGEAAQVLAFLDEITQKSTEPTHPRSSTPASIVSRVGTPVLRKSTERVRLGPAPGDQTAQQTPSSDKVGSWAWGSVWSTASAAIKQAKSAVDEQVRALPNEQARKWGEGVIEYARNAQLDKLGQDFKRVGLSTLNDLLNVVAPPISEHEVIRVWLSHDLQGYDGVESLTYKSLSRIMEQVQGGDLVVNRGNESRPKDSSTQERDLNAVDNYDAALKLTEANVEEMLKAIPKPKPSTVTSPTTYSDVYVRVQPFFAEQSKSSYEIPQQDLRFLLYLADPEHHLIHTTLTQPIPQRWLDMWDDHDWVEDLVAEALRLGIEVIGQEYIVARMGWSARNEQDQCSDADDLKER
ncbi:hypothetical protein APHAL10511_006525 [Amanita phalloides]|nr:hypothetical protein APHAL10511_006525 [Amanita phalloides]